MSGTNSTSNWHKLHDAADALIAHVHIAIMHEAVINMATSSGELNLVKKPNTTSVWNYFGVTADETGVPIHAELKKPICRLCKKTVPAKRSNTTNLYTHLEDQHPSVFAEIVPTTSRVQKRKQATSVEVVEKAKKYVQLQVPESAGTESRCYSLHCQGHATVSLCGEVRI